MRKKETGVSCCSINNIRCGIRHGAKRLSKSCSTIDTLGIDNNK